MQEGDIMLKKFSVKNFKGFENELVFDLSKTNDYQFNKQCINNGISKNSLIYGKNGSGKSNLGFALFDIVMTITDKSREMFVEYNNYKNLNNDIMENVEFKYEFKFDDDILVYEYKKKDLYTMIYEKLIFNDNVILEYDFNNKDRKIINIEEAKNLNWLNEESNQNISIVKYIYNNTILAPEHPISKLMSFVNGMLWFRSVQFNQYMGFMNGTENLIDIILKNNKLKDFERFLREKEIDYELIPLQESTGNKIGIKFKKGVGNFESIISTGTKSLLLYYCWSLRFEKMNFVFIDEFDANYHFELSAEIIKFLNEQKNLQTIVTTHNVSLMTNKITRPDCVYIISNNKINNLSNCTDKELREAHNIEKLYREGCFTD